MESLARKAKVGLTYYVGSEFSGAVLQEVSKEGSAAMDLMEAVRFITRPTVGRNSDWKDAGEYWMRATEGAESK